MTHDKQLKTNFLIETNEVQGVEEIICYYKNKGFLGIGYLYFDTLADYEKAFGPNAEKILGDIPNYTNIQPIVQISQVIK